MKAQFVTRYPQMAENYQVGRLKKIKIKRWQIKIENKLLILYAMNETV
jgi:hypothetical protein